MLGLPEHHSNNLSEFRKKPGSREKKPGYVRLEGLEPPTF
jgi:hypothetical protein